MMIAAAYLDELTPGEALKPSVKLVLMAYADSSDEHTLESAPGFAKIRAWSGLGRSQASAVVAQLVAAGLLTRIVEGRLGRRAVYRVFPNGVPAIPRPSEVAARYTDPATLVETPSEEGPAHRPLGSDSDPTRVRPTGPLHAVTSVSSARAPQQSTARPPATGFPGSRATDEDARGVARRARGALNVVCPLHSDQYVPCGRCAKAANETPPETRVAALAAARAAARTATEETPKP